MFYSVARGDLPRSFALAAGLIIVLASLLAVQGCGTDDDVNGEETSSQAAAAAIAPPAMPVEITSLSVEPESVAEGSPIAFTVSVKGTAAEVTVTDELQPVATAGEFIPVFTEPLVKGPTEGDITTWTLETTATEEGTHRFYATAVLDDGSRIVTIERPTYTVDST